ncbi:MAG TPA: FtsX-like permease family protein, partial [Ktedonobacterales bacterium]
AVLFFLLTWIILQNLPLAIGAVAGTGVFLVVLSLVFALVVFLIGNLPVLERFQWWYVLLIVGAVAISALVARAFPALGAIFLVLSLLGVVVVLLPRNWKANVKMALRNIGRQRTRTVTTLVALYIGIFAIGLILALGQDIKDRVNSALTTLVTYNSYVITGTNDRAALDAELQKVSGIKGQVVNSITTASPVSVDGVSIGDILRQSTEGGSNVRTARGELLAYLSLPEGYDLAANSLPQVTIVKGAGDATTGRNLTSEDAGTNNVILPQRASLAPVHAKLGSQIVLTGPDGKMTETLTVVGFYSGFSFVGGGLYSDNSLTTALSGGREFFVYSLKLDPQQAKAKLNQIQSAVPAAQTFSVVDFALFITDLLNNLIVMLTALASLAMIAGIVIIANAVALAMLERRRELGILKAVGHTSRDVLGEVLIENGIVGFTGGLLAMLLVTLAMSVLARLVFKTDFGVSTPITIGIIAAAAAVCMVVAALVAWDATRVRPIEVLRYE